MTKKNIEIINIAKWIESVRNMFIANPSECGTYFYPLDGDLQIAIGWTPGCEPSDMEDSCYIYDPTEVAYAKKHNQSCYVVGRKICERVSDEYEYLYMPWNTEKVKEKGSGYVPGDVYDTDSSLDRTGSAMDTAKELYKDFLEIRKGLDEGFLTL